LSTFEQITEEQILEEINYEDRSACVCDCGSVDCWNVC
jgi:hypothetical protein